MKLADQSNDREVFYCMPDVLGGQAHDGEEGLHVKLWWGIGGAVDDKAIPDVRSTVYVSTFCVR